MLRDSQDAVFEFFAGGGLARVGLGAAWRVTFANDLSPLKAAAYRAAFGGDEFREGDVGALTPTDLPGSAGLAWASFPCQDLSLAGPRQGLAAARSGAFFGFWRLVEGLAAQGRAPRLIVLENVPGLLTSRGGADFAALGALLAGAGYRFGAALLDAVAFTPQSRPRVFVVARHGLGPAVGLEAAGPAGAHHPAALLSAHAGLDGAARRAWAWWRLPAAPLRNTTLADLLDDPPVGVCWNGPEKTARLLDLMAPRQRARVEALRTEPGRAVGALFRRVRVEDGVRRQRVEARFDGLAGCLRTPAGGSSRQGLLVIEDGRIRSRLISAREAARLMGLRDDHPLPAGQTAALQVLGDGVAPPVVRFLSEHLLEPLRALGPAAQL